jgi:uncharacterized integral membrane protein
MPLSHLERINKWYFTPRKWERHGNGAIYRWLGVAVYKRHLPTTGDLMRRWRGLKHVDLARGSRRDELLHAEQMTRRYEWRHWIGCVVFILLAILIDQQSNGREFTVLDGVFLVALNLVINVYPIMLQRYNRVRIMRVLEKCT